MSNIPCFQEIRQEAGGRRQEGKKGRREENLTKVFL